jgi:Ca2+-dependent lipid-binding protein
VPPKWKLQLVVYWCFIQEYKTSVISNSLNPTFDSTFTFQVDASMVDELQVTVFDHDVLSDDVMATASVFLPYADMKDEKVLMLKWLWYSTLLEINELLSDS